jgi:protein-tyrosine phosphatase
MTSVLFVCTGNKYRSPIAAAAFLARSKQDEKNDDWRINSAGTWTKPGQPPPADALQAARKLGLSIDDHLTCLISAEEIAAHDLILVMEHGHKEALLVEFPQAYGKVYLLSEAAEKIAYNIPDPAGRDRLEVQRAARQLYDLIQRGYDSICILAQSLTQG